MQLRYMEGSHNNTRKNLAKFAQLLIFSIVFNTVNMKGKKWMNYV